MGFATGSPFSNIRDEKNGGQGMIHHYGPSDHQIVEIIRPGNPRENGGLIVLVHGGYWRAKFDRTLMNPIAHDLTSRGWCVANVEYRRTGAEGGWPITADDVRTAILFVRKWAAEQDIHGPFIGVGHSVGGQLALLAAAGLDAVVALAPVTDVARADREGLGENAAREFMRASSNDAPREYADASPICQLPLNKPQLLVHGDIDARVPVAHTRDFQAAAHARGDEAKLIIVPQMGHLDAIDPAADHWPPVLQWLGEITAASGKPFAS